jgi:hypothetical protein
MTSPLWRDRYKDALLETDPTRISTNIELAQQAIQQRLLQYSQPITSREREDIESALRYLHVLTRLPT